MGSTDSVPVSAVHALEGAAGQRALLAVLAARRTVAARDAARLERRVGGAGREGAGRPSTVDLRAQLAALEARRAELDRTVAGLAAALERPDAPNGR